MSAHPHRRYLLVLAAIVVLLPDDGQGMALLVETQHHRLLYDTGPAYGADANAGSRVIVRAPPRTSGRCSSVAAPAAADGDRRLPVPEPAKDRRHRR